MRYGFERYRHPIYFQGGLRKRNYFEGWYFKHVSRDRSSVLALIPGISLSPHGSRSFIQLIDGATGATRWFPFPLDAFSFARDRFEIRVADSTFSLDGVQAFLRDETGDIEARVRYTNVTPLPFSIASPGIMGPYSYAPLMECYHGIGSLDHELEGEIRVGGRSFDFNGGRGYIEKDWGKSFPQSWIWAQSNTFEVPGVSLLFSLARIPWMGRTFPGFFSLLREGGRIHRLATYTGAKVSEAWLRGKELFIKVASRHLTLTLRVHRSHEGVLLAPRAGAMDRRIGESIDARIFTRLADSSGATLFEGVGEAAGLEVVGDLSLIGVATAPDTKRAALSNL
jgi:tocopherol cyclase